VLDAVAAKKPGSPEWWLLRLGRKLTTESSRFDLLESYWNGTPPLPHGNERMRKAYRRLQRLARTNFGALVAEAVLERLKIVGFRAGGSSTDEADKQAWEWWQSNHMDADSSLVHRMAVTLSRAYVIVIHEADPVNRRRVKAALKAYWDDIEEAWIAIVYLEDGIHYFKSTQSVKPDTERGRLWSTNSWDFDTNMGASGSIDNELGEVPVTPFVNRPDMAGRGLGEFEDVIDILDRINTVVLDRLVISAMQAYRQRWAKGVSLTDENGNQTDAFDPGADLLWLVEDADAQFGEFASTDLSPVIKSIESDVSHLAAITRTPPHYILAGIVNASGDALSVAETGLTSKTDERKIEYGESWERVYRQVAKQFAGPEVEWDAEVIWKDSQFRSLTERASASVQLKNADVPWKTRMRLLDFTPAEIERMEEERQEDALNMMLMNPMAGPVGPDGKPLPGQGPTTPGQGAAITPTQNVTTQRADDTKTSAADTKGGQTQSNQIGDKSANWRELYLKARQAGIKGASAMSIQQLRAALGG
jgi:hypothetical protein